MPIVTINERLHAPAEADATLTLTYARQKTRPRVRLDDGDELALYWRVVGACATVICCAQRTGA